MGVASANLTQLALEADVLCERTRNDGHRAFKVTQGHLASRDVFVKERRIEIILLNYLWILAPIERPRTTSY